jgi:Toprim domain
LPAHPPRHVHPAMIATFAMPNEPEPGRLAVPHDSIKGIHVTFLRPDGMGKASTHPDKIMLGASAGTPIVVAPMDDGLGLAITEGIEDAFSIHIATGLGAWAAGSAARLRALGLPVPAYTDLVTIVADQDEVGQRNAYHLAGRLRERGIAVDINTPGAEVAP